MTDIAADLAQLAVCWSSIGLRGASVEWHLDRSARLTGSLASRLRSALGPALAAAGVRSTTLSSIPGSDAPPALWFRGWDCPVGPTRTVRAELRHVGAVSGEWPAVQMALSRMRLPSADVHGPLARTVHCTVSGSGEVSGGASVIAADACLVETKSPLHLTAAGTMLTEPPPLEVLVRSAGDRLRQLCLRWGKGGEALPPVVGRAFQEARRARPSWARITRLDAVSRRSSSTGQTQLIRGVRGVFAYEDVGPLAMTVLMLGAEVGVGKGAAFGCGQLRVLVAETR